MSEIIGVKDLNLWYGQTQALKDINMNIEEHAVTALIGPSGCGKSTFLKTLNRMNDLIPGVRIEGCVEYCGKNIYDAGTDVNELRRSIGMVFQKPNPFPMSIYDNVAYGPRTHGSRKKTERDLAQGRRHLGRGKGQTQKVRTRALRRSAAEALHSPCTCGEARSAAHGRADERP